MLALGPDHVSTYALTLDDPDAEGLTGVDGDHLPVRPGARRWRERARVEQDEDRAAAMDELADERLGAAGLRTVRALQPRPAGTPEPAQPGVLAARAGGGASGPGAHAFDGALDASLERGAARPVPRGAAPRSDGSAVRLPPGGVGPAGRCRPPVPSR